LHSPGEQRCGRARRLAAEDRRRGLGSDPHLLQIFGVVPIGVLGALAYHLLHDRWALAIAAAFGINLLGGILVIWAWAQIERDAGVAT
jgi:hypothetical protein